ncbi:MAG: SDR family oxidoreductase [Myxococcales bacterium]|nr:SDR family oxidoreductase [Myxococcales bacterium]
MTSPEPTGRLALVTGASRGIGRAIAERLAADGLRVIASARSLASVEEVVASLAGSGHQALAMDLGDPASLGAGLASLAALGRVDVLVNNAGIAESAPYDRTDDAAWDRMMQVNARAPMQLCRALVPAMVEAGWGRVVTVASNAGLTGYAYSSAYCASKHAVIGYQRALALEVARAGVTVNAVCPGWVETEMAERAVTNIASKTGRTYEDAKKALERMSPQGRMTRPDEVAALVAMLASDDAANIHGQALAIDGGQVMQ